jgi:hypothetical protein
MVAPSHGYVRQLQQQASHAHFLAAAAAVSTQLLAHLNSLRCGAFPSSTPAPVLPPDEPTPSPPPLAPPQPALAPAAGAPTVKICLPVENEAATVAACNAAVAAANDAAAGVAFSCVAGISVESCLRQVQAGYAQMAKVPASGVYLGQRYNLVPVASENFGPAFGVSADGSNTEGYAVALVPPALCTMNVDLKVTVEDARGSTGCFSGYRTDGSWNTALGALIQAGVEVKPPNTTFAYTSDVVTAAGFFSAVSSLPSMCSSSFSGRQQRLARGRTARRRNRGMPPPRLPMPS